MARKCRNDLAAKNTFDFEAIDKDYEAGNGNGWENVPKTTFGRF